MQAAMSDKLRKILSDPNANRELEEGLSGLGSQKESTVITIGDKKYKAEFVESEPQIKK